MEIWKDIQGFETRYQISDEGRVKSLSRRVPNGKGFINKVERILKSRLSFKGYPCIDLNTHEGVKKNIVIHRLVAQAFIPNPENKPQVNHIDGNKQNNAVENLEWVTNSENMKHATINGLRHKPTGSKNHWAKLDENKVVEIREKYKKGGIRQQDLAKEYNICEELVQGITTYRFWKHVK